MSYRAIVTSECSIHGQHVVTLRGDDDMTVLMGMACMRELRDVGGLDCSISCYRDERYLGKTAILQLLADGMMEHEGEEDRRTRGKRT